MENKEARSAKSLNGARAWLWTLALSAIVGVVAINNRRPAVFAQGPARPPQVSAGATAGASTDYSNRVVAFLYGSVPITREELGEYLIQRVGAERLDALVNRRIIELECKKANVEVTEAEVEGALEEDLAGLNVDRKVFVDRVLKGYKKTLYEWKEDVIRPKLLLGKLARVRVKVTDDDLRKAFDAYHGEKVDCRIIMWEKGFEKAAMSEYAKIRDSEEEFARAAKNQKTPSLAAAGGKIRPIGRNTTGNEELEKAAFTLQPGEISSLIGTPEGLVVIKCDARQGADISIDFEAMRPKLTKEVFEKKLAAEIPALFAEMRKKAAPNIVLAGAGGPEDFKESVRNLLNQDDSGIKGPGNQPPGGDGARPGTPPRRYDPSIGNKSKP